MSSVYYAENPQLHVWYTLRTYMYMSCVRCDMSLILLQLQQRVKSLLAENEELQAEKELASEQDKQVLIYYIRPFAMATYDKIHCIYCSTSILFWNFSNNVD